MQIEGRHDRDGIAHQCADCREQVAFGIVLAVGEHRSMEREEDTVERTYPGDVIEQAGFEIGVAGSAERSAGNRAGGDQRHDFEIGCSADGERAGDFGLRLGERKEVIAFQ